MATMKKEQLDFLSWEFGVFFHFGIRTFNEGHVDWDMKPMALESFRPTELDCDEWLKTIRDAGAKYAILVCKHHDGFANWPSAYTEYSVKNTPWKDGKGDVVGELAAACKKYGIKFAVYLSPWDRNHAQYATPEYVDYFHAQLRELMTNYGEVFEVWFDGANGGDGWYGGAKESRTIDRKHYYNYPKIYEMLDELQPQAIIFSDGGPGCRWVGNERGFAGATNWSFLRAGEVFPGYSKHWVLQYGHPDGNQWVPAECNVSIRPGWFYHSEQDGHVKTVDQLTDLYYRSVGHNATLLLNFPVDRNGLVHPIDSANAVNFRKNIEKQLAHNLLKGIVPVVSDERGGKYTAKAMTDGDYDTYWAAHDSVLSASVEFALDKPTKINRMMLQEYIPLGQRVKAFTVEYDKDGAWLPVLLNEETTTIGYKRLLRFETVETAKLRVSITDSRACPTLNNVEAYYAGETADVSFNQTIEGLRGYDFTLLDVEEEEMRKACDKNDSTVCFVQGDRLVIDLGSERLVSSFHYLPDQGAPGKGLIASYEIAVGSDLAQIDKVVKQDEFSNIRNNPIMQSVYFSPVNARYVSLKPLRMVNEGEQMGIAEMVIR